MKYSSSSILLKYRLKVLHKSFSSTYPIAIPQWLEAWPEAASNSAMPIMATAGVIVRGVMNLKINPISPEVRMLCKRRNL